MKQAINISVRSLVEHVLRTGDLSHDFQGAVRALEGIRAHRSLQAARPDHYMTEVSVSHEQAVGGFMLKIRGRMDGIYVPAGHGGPDVPIAEEIKTTKRSLDRVKNEQNPLHWAQVKCYAFMYGLENGMDRMDTRLTYYQVEKRETLELNQGFTMDELALFFQGLIDEYIQWIKEVVDWIQHRDQTIATLDFPFRDYRPGQRDMAVGVYRNIRDGEQLIVQAATGIGKTMAAVYPAIKGFPEGYQKKIFYLAARTTGKRVSEAAVNELRARGLSLKSLTLTAKDKICFNPESACNGDECEYAKGFYDRVNQAVRFIFQKDALDRETIEETARAFRVCPFEFSLELSLWVDLIVCDYNYAFDPRAYLRRFFSEDPEDYTFLIDEAHNLVDRAREMFSAEIYKQPVLDVRRSIKEELPEVYRALTQINDWMLRAGKKCREFGTVLAEKEGPDDLYPILRTFLKSTERWLSRNKKRPFRDQLLDIYFSISGFLKVAEQYSEAYATIYEKIKKDLKIKLFCIDPSRGLKDALERSRSAVFFSATMTPAEYFKNILGCESRAKYLTIPSPFPQQNLGIFIADRISTYFKQRKETARDVAQTVLSLVSQKQGNYLVFFPSYQYLEMVYPLLNHEPANMEFICQTPGMTETQRLDFLNRFSRDNTHTLVGLAVMGGVFGEGIDLVGERLSGAAIVGVGLPGISLERELIRGFFAENQGRGFEFAYLYPGINRVLQAAGRVIRSDSDRGIVLLIDQRFTRNQYRRLLPEPWKPVRFHRRNHFRKGLDVFWDQANPDLGS